MTSFSYTIDKTGRHFYCYITRIKL